MTYVKINNTEYPATIYGRNIDPAWDNRESKTINLEGTISWALETFHDDLEWSIVERTQTDEGEQVQEWDNSEFSFAGDITDHRDGTLSIKMGKPTDLEVAYELLYG